MDKQVNVTPLYYDNILGETAYDAIVELGGRYSGKSYNSQIEEAANMMNKKDYRLLIIQKLDKGSADGYYKGLTEKINDFGHTSAYSISPSSTKIVNKYNGNTALFRGFKTDQQKTDVKNIDQITKIVVEEGEWMTFNDFLALLQQVRGKVKEDRRIDILLNPINEYCFVNEFLIQAVPDRVIQYFPNTNRPKVFERFFKIDSVDENDKPIALTIKILVVISTYHDNKYLTGKDKATIEIYKNTDKEKYLQLAEARFTSSGDSFFPEFNKDYSVIPPFVIPDYWKRIQVIDYGLDMLAGLWIAIDERGKAYIYRECNKKDLIISAAAKELVRLSEDEEIFLRYGPTDLWNRRQERGKSAYELFSDSGWDMNKADRNRVNGCLAVKEWLKTYKSKDIETGEEILDTDLYIFNNCTELIKNISIILKDEKDSNVYATQPHEITHDIDALRYFAIMRTAPTDRRMKEQEKASEHNFIKKKEEDAIRSCYTSNDIDAFSNYDGY